MVQQLPPEIILSIVGYALSDLRFNDRTAIHGILFTNRTIYALASERLYQVAVLRSSRMVNRFLDSLRSSPRLASLLVNLWIADHHLAAFPMQLGSIPNTVARILALVPNLRRLALPSEYFPRVSVANNIPSLIHLTITEDLFPLSTPIIPTLYTVHILGPLWPTRTETLISRCPNLKHIMCTIPFSLQTSYVTPAIQCTRALQYGLQSLTSIQFVCSKRVAIALRKGLADQIDHKEGLDIQVDTFDATEPTQTSTGAKWFQTCIGAVEGT